MRCVQDSCEVLNAPVTSPLTAELIFQSRLAWDQWQKVTCTHLKHTHSHFTYASTQTPLLPHTISHMHSTNANEKQIQNTHIHKDSASWINTLGYNPRDEPYGTSISSSITQSQKMAGSLSVSVCVCVRDKVSSSFVCIACHKMAGSLSVCVCMTVCVICSHWSQETAVHMHLSPCVRCLFAHI